MKIYIRTMIDTNELSIEDFENEAWVFISPKNNKNAKHIEDKEMFCKKVPVKHVEPLYDSITVSDSFNGVI